MSSESEAAIRLGPLYGEKTLIGNPPGLQRIKTGSIGPCSFEGDAYWLYQVKGQLLEDEVFKDKFIKVEAVKAVKSCLADADLDAKENFQNIILPEKLIKHEPKTVKLDETKPVVVHETETLGSGVDELVNKLMNVSESCKQDKCRFQVKTTMGNH